ncbi:hypothetical protein N7495_000980 [Penicillium taxi]|uniref:uncharacterized protein n=1 Tax=Penicillium taxi TaxID=168475 RepID=UPI0025456486|nr:uncharacterized protein N7495_000980 [Penicillium taxi]KAJ5908298.1 hypothetical protein N7495_000980 [Penicillium taxi]
MGQPSSDLFVRSPPGDGGMTIYVAAGWIGLIWYIVVQVVCALGYFQVSPVTTVTNRQLRNLRWRWFSRRPSPSPLATTSDAPHVTAIRPVKGLEPYLYDCLAATFRQDYPRDKLTVCLCLATRDDPAYPILRKVIDDFPNSDARLYIEEEDPLLQGNGTDAYILGPNPKIRNMSRAYREAKSDDIIWIIDCNVWIGKGVCARMVDKLCGWTNTGKKYKFVHHLPMVVDVTGDRALNQQEPQSLLDASRGAFVPQNLITSCHSEDGLSNTIGLGGGRLEELFLSSSHAKFYTAINTVLIAPCIVGKSNMFRRAHLDYLTGPSPNDLNRRLPGIDFFSFNICEDHLIGDLLWRKKVREEKELGETWGKHAMVFGDLAVQPVANMSIGAYIARRVRWLRVRKFTVLLATLVEPGTESFVCTLYGAWGLTSALAPYLEQKGFKHSPSLGTWSSFFVFFFLGLASWILVDWTLYIKLHSAKTVELDDETPKFAQPVHRSSRTTTRRPFLQWFAAWLGRELLALPIWLLAFYGGVTVVWRDRRFKVGFDAKVREINSHFPRISPESSSRTSSTDSVTAQNNGKLHKVRCE